ncbi:hypothetical protein AK88_05301 [Plasmodium fragile]|uniref:Uncharacterized protein n=1 Tax=Plasmodium fragile TaxID=5857 RepID=A0A0D9QDG1_PLAFR|nr:uncharacterized protein AK88_05301 [Plasmodium fragile]KJP85063.1 hypothetical protein AK88_05301 [Plasmodium fragile]
MAGDVIDFVFTLILDTEIYFCVFVLLTYLTTRKINKIIQSNFYQKDALLNRLSKNFYITDVKAYFSPLKYMRKSALYHTYYLSSVLVLIYLFRLYSSYKRWIKFYFFSLLNISTDPSALSDHDDFDAHYDGKSSHFGIGHLVAFLLGIIISFIYYKYLCKIFKGKHKYVKVHKSSLLPQCFDLAKTNFREYVKVKPKKGSKFKFHLDTNIKAHPTLSSGPAATGNGKSGNGSGAGTSAPTPVTPKTKRNILFRMFDIGYLKNHVLYDENVLYEDQLKNKGQTDQKNKRQLWLLFIKLMEKLLVAIINLINIIINEIGKGASGKTAQPPAGQAATSQAATGQEGPQTAAAGGETAQEGMKQTVDGEATMEENKPEEEEPTTGVNQPEEDEHTTEEKQLEGENGTTEEKQLEEEKAITEEKETQEEEAITEEKQQEGESPEAETIPTHVESPTEGQSSETPPQEQRQEKDSQSIMTQIKEEAMKSSDMEYNDINLCELDLNPHDQFVCNSHYHFKSIVEVLMLHMPMYFLFKNKFYAKALFTIAMYIWNYLVWNFITLLAMIKPSLFVYYYVLNEHINHILLKNINEHEKNIILHFFYGFFVASLIYLKFHFSLEFKLIKVDHMNHFHRMINGCIVQAHKLKSTGIIKNFEAMKIFPLCIDYKKKGIFIDRGLLRTAAELQLVLKQRKLKNVKICFRNIKQIAKYCDEDTAMEMFKQLKFVLVNELPNQVALNLSHMISDEMYNQIKTNCIDPSSSTQSKKHPPDCLCEMLKKTGLHDYIKAAMSTENCKAENEPADRGQAYVDTSDKADAKNDKLDEQGEDPVKKKKGSQSWRVVQMFDIGKHHQKEQKK